MQREGGVPSASTLAQKASLDSDILKEAEQIRRERNSKRAREAQRERAEAEAKSSGQQQHVHIQPQPHHRRTGSREPTTDDEGGIAEVAAAGADTSMHVAHGNGIGLVDGGALPAGIKEKVEEDRVLVGNLIGEDHVNYVLMYNMLTGIRIGVSAPSYFSVHFNVDDVIGLPLSSQDEAPAHRRRLYGRS